MKIGPPFIHAPPVAASGRCAVKVSHPLVKFSQAPNKARTRKQPDELVFDHTGAVDVEFTRAERPPSRTKAVAFTPPPKEKKLLTVYAVTFIQGEGWTDSSRRVLTYLIKCAHPTTGACFPSVLHIADKLGIAKRTVERAITFLTATPYLKRESLLGGGHCQWDH